MILMKGNGYEFDTFAGEENAPFFLGTIIGNITGDSGGFISNYREWHILLSAIVEGFKTKTLGNIPDCPPLWVDEQQYWDVPCMVSNVIKCQWPTASIVLSAYATKLMGVW